MGRGAKVVMPLIGGRWLFKRPSKLKEKVLVMPGESMTHARIGHEDIGEGQEENDS